MPDEQRAYGEGMPAFGDMTLRIQATSVGSINNVALQLSLETPPDGHSGHTAARVLLWQARHGIPISRLTTHAASNRSRSSTDPRSFHGPRFEAAYRQAAKRCGFAAYDIGRATWRDRPGTIQNAKPMTISGSDLLICPCAASMQRHYNGYASPSMPSPSEINARFSRWLATSPKHKLVSIQKKFENLLLRLTTKTLSLGAKSLGSHPFLRKAYYYSLPANSILVVHTKDAHFILNSSDRAIGRDTFINRTAFDSEKLNLVLGLLPASHRRELLIDIGANIGTICIHAVAAGLFSKALAFEPEPNNFALLKANIAFNNLEHLITAHRSALSSSSGHFLEFELCESNHGDHRVRVSTEAGLHEETGRPVIHVPTETLDHCSGDIQADSTLIWIDTQGYEGHVFLGGRDAINRQVPICLEFWPYGLRRANAYELLLEALAEAPYKLLIDLSKPEKPQRFSTERLKELSEELGDQGGWTDLLLI